MQLVFDFGTRNVMGEVARRLAARFGAARMGTARSPIAQLVKSLISSRTYDAVSLEAYERLVAAFSWSEMAAAPPRRIEALIAGVTFADVKARHLGAALRQVEAERADFDLGFLGAMTETEALAWLERLPGVGRKVAASVLNFSTLGRRAFVIDLHVLRILRRVGVAGARAPTAAIYDGVMDALGKWPAANLAELHIHMKRLGQQVCRPKQPRCGECPLAGLCKAPSRTGMGGAIRRGGGLPETLEADWNLWPYS